MVSARTSAYLWRGIPSRCGQRSGSAARGHARRPCAMQRQLPAKGAKTPAYGAFLMSGSPHVAELMACMGFDFLVVDMEHSPIGFETATAMLQAARAGGARTVLLRVECDRAEVLKRALDIGPDGIIVPLISTPEAAAGVIAACRYPHDGGVRGVAYPLVRASRWGTDPDYLHAYKDRVMILPQIETQAGADCAAEILKTEGISGVFLGPLDLSSSLGCPGNTDDARVVAALDAIVAATRAQGKLVCGYCSGGPEASARLLASGTYDMVAGAVDVGLLKKASLADVGAVRALLDRA